METLLFLNLSAQAAAWLIVGEIIFLLCVIVPLLIYFVLAPNDIFFTFGKENVAKFVMKGQKFSGKVILSSKTIFIDNNYNFRENTPNLNYTPRKVYKNFMGIYWIGLWPFYSIKYRRQQWMEWKSTKNGRRIEFRDELTPYLMVKPFEYAMLLEEGEDKNGMPLNALFTVILQPTNAVLPIFGNDDAYGQVQTLCLGATLLYVREKTFSNLGGENLDPTKIDKDEFSKIITDLNTKIPGRYKYNSDGTIAQDNNGKPIEIGIIEALGYRILDAKLNSIEIVGKNKDALVEASTADYIAGEHAKAEVTRAKGDRDAMIERAKGKEAELNVQTNFYKQILYIPGAMDVEKRKATPGITTLVENNDGKTSIIVGGNK